MALMLAHPLARAKATYVHASVGNIDMVSGMSEERTRRLMHELLEMRAIILDLTGSTVGWDRPLEIVVFSTQQEMEEFFPREDVWIWSFNTKWFTQLSPMGDCICLAGDRLNDQMYRQEAMETYLREMVRVLVPRCPYWVSYGLARTLCTLEYRNETVRLGVIPTIIPGRKRNVEKLPLAKLMNNDTFSNTEHVLDPWHFWLTESSEASRVRIRQLFEEIRLGGSGDGEAVSRVFGTSLADLQAQLKKHMGGISNAVIERPPLAPRALDAMALTPATVFEGRMARGIFASQTKDDAAIHAQQLLALATGQPDSPRPMEALARLASVTGQTQQAEEYWARARDLGTRNPYAYLALLQQRVGPRTGQIDLRASLPPALTQTFRAAADRCIALNPAEFAAYEWLAWIEALASEPHADRLAVEAACKARYISPGIYLPLVLANIRLKRYDEVRTLVAEYRSVLHGEGANELTFAALLQRIEKEQ